MGYTINLTAHLRAYTRISMDDFALAAPVDGEVYAQKDGEWFLLTNRDTGIVTDENSGLSQEVLENGELKLDIKQYLGDELPETLESDTTYYIADKTADIYIVGGTAYSDGDNDFIDDSEYGDTILGGSATTSSYELILLPLNGEGVYNG